MKKSLLLVSLLGAMLGAQAQTFTRYISQPVAPRKDTRIQNDGSWFEGLKKYNADGSVAWDNTYSGIGILSKIDVLDITDDGAGGAIVVGGVTGKVYRGTDTISSGAPGYSNVFIARFSATGKLWHITNTNNDALYARDDKAVGVYKVGSDIYVGGIVASRDFTFGTYAFPRTLTDPTCRSFLAKLDMDGAMSWAKFTSGGGRVEAHKLTKDNTDNFYLLGYVSGSGVTTFGTGVTLDGHGMANYIAKFDKDGTALLAKGFEEGMNYTINAIAADNSQNIYLSGFTGTEFDVDGNTFKSNASYIMKLSNTGAYQWMRTLNPDIKINSIPGLFFLNNKIYFAGTASSSPTVYLQTNATDSTTINKEKLIIGSYTTDGVCDWHMQPTNTTMTTAPSHVSYLHASPDGQVLAVGGTFINNDNYGTLTIPAPSIVPYNYGYITVRVGGPASTPATLQSALAATIYPNPASATCTIALPASVAALSVSVSDVTGRVLISSSATHTTTHTINTSVLVPGIYTVRITDGVATTTQLLHVR